MKIYSYILVIMFGVMTVQCGKDELEDTLPKQDSTDDYNSYWYYSYEAVNKINALTLNMEQADEFIPYTVAHIGDTLLVANIGGKGNSLMLFSQKDNKLLSTIKSWQFDNKTLSFGSWIEAIVPAGDRLYISERQSRIHVFRLPDLDYITCIGNGNWNGPVFQAQALTVNDGLILARDKNGKVSIYKESDATKDNYQKTKRYKHVSGNGSSNNSFAAHYMQPDVDGRILLSDYENKIIRVIDPSLINDDLPDNTSIDIDEHTMALDFKPKTFAICNNRWYVTGNNDAINIYDRDLQEWCRALKAIKGYAFSQPTRIYAQNDSVLWVSDTHSSKRTLVKMVVHKGEIRD